MIVDLTLAVSLSYEAHCRRELESDPEYLALCDARRCEAAEAYLSEPQRPGVVRAVALDVAVAS